MKIGEGGSRLMRIVRIGEDWFGLVRMDEAGRGWVEIGKDW